MIRVKGREYREKEGRGGRNIDWDKEIHILLGVVSCVGWGKG